MRRLFRPAFFVVLWEWSMPKLRRRRARVVRYNDSRAGVRADITPADFVRLQNWLLSRPDAVLQRFAECGIGSLLEVPVYHEIKRLAPESAAQLRLMAIGYGIASEDCTVKG
jgi:hypothetical protein